MFVYRCACDVGKSCGVAEYRAFKKSRLKLSHVLGPGPSSCRRLQILAAFSNIPEDVVGIKRRGTFNNYTISRVQVRYAYFSSETILAAALVWKMRLFWWLIYNTCILAE